jgi:hypothetical protein
LTDSFADAEESSPKSNLNGTFQIKNGTTEVTPPLRMQGCYRTSTPSGKSFYSNLKKKKLILKLLPSEV